MKDLIPKEGATGWADTWMLSANAKHPNCAYMWMKWVSTPKVQAQQAIYFGETPVEHEGVPDHEQAVARAPQRSTTAAPRAAYFNSIKFWKTPIAELRQRQERLHGLHAVAAGLDAAEGLTAGRSRC